jgi:hypothetical protein
MNLWKIENKDDLCIQMDQSLNSDILKCSQFDNRKSNIPRPTDDDDPEDSLNLSPINRSEVSYTENSMNVGLTRSRRKLYVDSERGSLATPVITPLYKPKSAVLKPMKYCKTPLNKTYSAVDPPPKPMIKKSKIESKPNRRSKYILEGKGFKDLMQYQN